MSQAAVIQMASGHTVGLNLIHARALIEKAHQDGAQLVVLPECFASMALGKLGPLVHQEPFGKGRIQNYLSELAEEFGVWIVGGTIPIESDDPTRAYASCGVWNDQGECVARYSKIHLFDVFIDQSGESRCESAYTYPGDETVVVDTPLGCLGLAVCYDLRFPELFRQLRAKGAELIACPSAFTQATGQMHWHTLLKARAIENQCYLLAANQGGVHDNNAVSYGHSCIVDPLGVVNGRDNALPSCVTGTINLDKLHALRQDFPVWDHRRLNT